MKFTTQFLDVKDAKNKTISTDIRLVAKPDEFITFKDINTLYKQISAKYKTGQIAILTTNPAGKKSMIKKIGETVDDLELDDEDYYNKLKKEDRAKFDEFTSVQFIIKTSKYKI